ncbi:MAG: alpha/beta fold hydrolase [Desulfatibacillum sp.]|nr:alpha/beta fold hydrolase [Desulfatibacillum sp.]
MAQEDLRENEKIISLEVDGILLKGTFHDPGVSYPPVVIGCHGLFADRQSPKQTALARAVCKEGIAFLRLDHRGCGDSQGDFKRVTTLANRLRDLLGAMDFVKSQMGLRGKMGLFGSSMGGAVCLKAAMKKPVDCLIANAAPIDFTSVIDVLRKSGQHNLLSQAFYEENPVLVKDQDLPISRILVFHGHQDETVPVSHALALHAMCQEPKKLRLFKNGDHRMSSSQDQGIFIRESVKWYKEFLL